MGKKVYKNTKENIENFLVKDEGSVEYLSLQEEKKYSRMIKDIKVGKKVTKTSSLDELLNLLD